MSCKTWKRVVVVERLAAAKKTPTSALDDDDDWMPPLVNDGCDEEDEAKTPEFLSDNDDDDDDGDSVKQDTGAGQPEKRGVEQQAEREFRGAPILTMKDVERVAVEELGKQRASADVPNGYKIVLELPAEIMPPLKQHGCVEQDGKPTLAEEAKLRSAEEAKLQLAEEAKLQLAEEAKLQLADEAKLQLALPPLMDDVSEDDDATSQPTSISTTMPESVNSRSGWSVPPTRKEEDEERTKMRKKKKKAQARRRSNAKNVRPSVVSVSGYSVNANHARSAMMTKPTLAW